MVSKPVDRVSFASITPNNLGTVRKLNSVLFPIKYSTKFYEDVQSAELEEFCKLGTLLGMLCEPMPTARLCRVLTSRACSLFQ
jgi:hypothetical protein